jgi:hypothetical protein
MSIHDVPFVNRPPTFSPDIRWIATDDFAVSKDGRHVGYADSYAEAQALAVPHTPLPWHRTHNTLNVFSDGYKAAIAATFSYEYRESGPSKAEAEANAAFIFRACNAHDDMIAALLEIRDTTGDHTSANIARAALTKVGA